MRIKLFEYISFGVILFLFTCSLAGAEEWAEVKGDHFIVYFQGPNKNFASQAARKAEEYYLSIAQDLGYVRYSGFWKWENRVRIFIYPDRDKYLESTGRPQWSRGMADYTKKQIVSYMWSENFLEVLLAHEIGHLIFRDFVGFKGEVPLWLDEGVAQWEEKQFRIPRKMAMKNMLEENKMFSFLDMMKLEIKNIDEEDPIFITSSFNGKNEVKIVEGKTLIEMYYLQSFSLVGFLMEEYRGEKFIAFCRQLRDGKSVQEALGHTYPTDLRTFEDLEEKWRKYILK
ncbi:MAG: hypothetical protein ABII88_01380 [Candidatus Omnitrophota bacterium]